MIHTSLRAATRGALCLALASASAAPLAAQSPAPSAPTDAQTEEIVVTAQRSGIPVWHVRGPSGSAVLVGSIGGVTAGTKWDPVPLEAALNMSDRVMFPESMAASGGLFSLIGAIGKWRKQASLPKGQTLQAMTTPAQWARLVALRDKGILKPGFERKHPFHLAMTLDGTLKDRRKGDPGADAYVSRFVRKNKAKRVPTAQVGLKPLLNDFFGSAPRTHVPCLMDAVTRAEAGRAGVEARFAAAQARSTAWAARRVADALAASAGIAKSSCWPYNSRYDEIREATLSPTMRSLLARPQVTLAVVSLDSLAKPGGVLDDLVAAGFDVRGPRWKR